MTWGYRVFLIPAGSVLGQDAYVIREVYYDENDQIEFWSEENVFPVGESEDDLWDDLQLIGEAFQRPVILCEGEHIVELRDPETDELEDGEMLVDVELEEDE
jgi:hypothetical protein